MRLFILLPFLTLSGACSAPPPAPETIAARGPGPAYDCLAPRLSGRGLRQHTETTEFGWWMDVEVLSGPPTGWYSKGRVEYATGAITYIPEGATQGIAEKVIETRLLPALHACGAS